MTLPELDLELDAPEERRRWMENERIQARLEPVGEAGAAVAVGLGRCDLVGPSPELARARPQPAGPQLCRARGWRAMRSRSESSRLDPMGTRDLGLVGPDERTAAHHVLAADDQPLDPMRGREHETGDQVVGASELQPAGTPDRKVGLLAWLERADVVATQHRGSPARRESQCFAGSECIRPAAPARNEQRLLDLEEEVAALVRGRAVDSETYAGVRIDELAHGGDTGTEAEIRRRAVRDARAGSAEALDVLVGEMHAVRAPDVVGEPAQPVEVLDRRAAVELAAVGVLLDGLREVRVQRQTEPARERRPTPRAGVS